MDRKEWKEFVEDLYRAEIEPKLRIDIRKHHPMEWSENQYRLDRLVRASRVIRLVCEEAARNDDLSTVFQAERLASHIDDLRSAHEHFNKRILLDSGIVDVIERNLEYLAAGIKFKDIPVQDIRALREGGSANAEEEVRITIRQLKTRSEKGRRNSNEMTLEYSIKRTSEYLQSVGSELKEQQVQDVSERKQRKRWWKGLGSLCRGTALTGVDITLLAGAWTLNLSPDTTIVGGVASIVTGLGDIAIGVGEFRDE